MATKLFVGSLPFDTTQDQLKELFEQYGAVESAVIIMDRETNRSRGFGFVEFSDADAAQKAISELNNQDYNGRKLTVNEARPKNG